MLLQRHSTPLEKVDIFLLPAATKQDDGFASSSSSGCATCSVIELFGILWWIELDDYVYRR
jgi:hypothetical protein